MHCFYLPGIILAHSPPSPKLILTVALISGTEGSMHCCGKLQRNPSEPDRNGGADDDWRSWAKPCQATFNQTTGLYCFPLTLMTVVLMSMMIIVMKPIGHVRPLGKCWDNLKVPSNTPSHWQLMPALRVLTQMEQHIDLPSYPQYFKLKYDHVNFVWLHSEH